MDQFSILFKVYYVDYGNTDTVDNAVVRAMTSLFSSRPPQGIAVSLATVDRSNCKMNLEDVRALIDNREATIRLSICLSSIPLPSLIIFDFSSKYGCDARRFDALLRQ